MAGTYQDLVSQLNTVKSSFTSPYQCEYSFDLSDKNYSDFDIKIVLTFTESTDAKSKNNLGTVTINSQGVSLNETITKASQYLTEANNVVHTALSGSSSVPLADRIKMTTTGIQYRF